ncbi:MAG: dTDP-4-dehydrorhamnose reductase [Bacillota bacterium]
MKVLVTGAQGQLGSDVVKLLKQEGINFIGCTRQDVDIKSMETVRRKFLEYNPDVIIHTAAYTQVDLAESNEEEAFLVNAYGTRNLLIMAQEIGAVFCYISTDYVFDGKSSSPYKEYDQVNPLGVYGKSKYAGEEFVKSLTNKYFIVRTSWLYGAKGNNFVKTMLRLAEEKDNLGVVDDQVGSPTYTVDLAHFLLELIQTEKYGIYHATNLGCCSWYDFACAIFEEVGKKIEVKPLTTDEFPRQGPRPKYSVLDHLAIRSNGFQYLPPWRDALQKFMKEL